MDEKHCLKSFFFDRFTKGHIEDSEDYTEWANDYRHYLSILP